MRGLVDGIERRSIGFIKGAWWALVLERYSFVFVIIFFLFLEVGVGFVFIRGFEK